MESRKTREEAGIVEEERGTDWGGDGEGIERKRRRLIRGECFTDLGFTFTRFSHVHAKRKTKKSHRNERGWLSLLGDPTCDWPQTSWTQQEAEQVKNKITDLTARVKSGRRN
jgi:hypothetical protein